MNHGTDEATTWAVEDMVSGRDNVVDLPMGVAEALGQGGAELFRLQRHSRERQADVTIYIFHKNPHHAVGKA